MKSNFKILFSLVIIIFLSVIDSSYSFKVISAAGKTLKWLDTDITFKINDRGSDDFSGGSDEYGKSKNEYDILKDSFNSWQSVGDIDLNVEYAGLSTKEETGIDDENSVIFVENNWKSLPFQPPVVALAVTISSFDFDKGEIFDSDIHFNGEHFRWADIDSDEEGTFADLQSIATHEIGHFLGLDHSSEDPNESNETIRESVMFYSSGLGETENRTLKEDDLSGIQHLYSIHNENFPTPEVGAVTPTTALNNQVIEVDINGNNFAPNTVVKLTHEDSDYPDIIAPDVNVKNGGNLRCSFDLKYAVPGKYNISVSNTPDRATTIKKGFEVVDSGTSTYYNTSSFYEYDSGGCFGAISARQSNSNIFFTTLLILFPILFYLGLKRRVVISQVPYQKTITVQKPSRYLVI